MIEIHTTNYDTQIHCIICGTVNTDLYHKINSCLHLVYFRIIANIEFSGVGESILITMDSEQWKQHEIRFEQLKKTLDDEHLCIHVDFPGPPITTQCIIYNLHNITNTPEGDF